MATESLNKNASAQQNATEQAAVAIYEIQMPVDSVDSLAADAAHEASIAGTLFHGTHKAYHLLPYDKPCDVDGPGAGLSH